MGRFERLFARLEGLFSAAEGLVSPSEVVLSWSEGAFRRPVAAWAPWQGERGRSGLAFRRSSPAFGRSSLALRRSGLAARRWELLAGRAGGAFSRSEVEKAPSAVDLDPVATLKLPENELLQAQSPLFLPSHRLRGGPNGQVQARNAQELPGQEISAPAGQPGRVLACGRRR